VSAPSADSDARLDGMTEHELLLLMDLAMETLEGLDQLGVESRAELETLLSDIERRIAEDA
jgi:hypothetical protein